MKKNRISIMRLSAFFPAIIILFCALSACHAPNNARYQNQFAIKNGTWQDNFQPMFSVDIKDTSARYQTYVLLRQDNAYPFSNIWLRLFIKAPGDTLYSKKQRINLRLADVSGRWLGKGMGSIWGHKIPLNSKDNLIFKQKGNYKIKIEQIMRKNPLPGILNVGLIIQKK